MALIKEKSDIYLDAKEVDYGSTREAVAYLHSTRLGTARNSEGFVAFYLKDVNHYIITGRLFNVENFLEKGFHLSVLKKRPVKLRFMAQDWNGSLSLIVYDLEPWDGEFDYSKFLGKLEGSDKILELCNSAMSKYGIEDSFRQSYVNDSYLSVCNGMTGGYAKLIQMVINSVLAFKGTPGVVIEELMKVTEIALNSYSRYLDLEERLDVVLKNETLKMIYEITQGIEDERLKNVCVDTISAITGLGRPEHLYANIVSDTLLSCKKLLQYSYEYPLITNGASKKIGSDVLSKY